MTLYLHLGGLVNVHGGRGLGELYVLLFKTRGSGWIFPVILFIKRPLVFPASLLMADGVANDQDTTRGDCNSLLVSMMMQLRVGTDSW